MDLATATLWVQQFFHAKIEIHLAFHSLPIFRSNFVNYIEYIDIRYINNKQTPNANCLICLAFKSRRLIK